MKRILVAVLSVAILMGLLVGCTGQSSPGTDSSNQPQESVQPTETQSSTTQAKVTLKPFKLGWAGAGSADDMVNFIRTVKWACDAAGGELVTDFSSTSAEALITVVENLISGGCDLISVPNFFGEAPFPQISKICQENQVYWVLWDTTVTDPDIQEILKNDPYFVGFTQEDQIKVGTDGANALVAAGCKNIIIYEFGPGYTTDQRREGVQKVCDENNVNIVDIIQAPQDPKKAMADSLLAHPEADGFFANGGYLVPMVSAIQESGRDVKVTCCDLFDGIDQYFDDGTLVSVDSGNMSSNFFAVMLLLNAYNGTPLTTGEDTVYIPEFTFTSAEQVREYEEYCQNDTNPVYTSEDLPLFLKALDPSLTLESFQQNINDTWDLDTIVAKFSK